MNSVEDAYQEIAKSIIHFIEGRPWDYAVFESEIYSSMTKNTRCLVYAGLKDATSIGWGDSSIDSGGAVFLLRENMLRATGQRIWGLTFTLYPDGKFNIEYNYNKPEGYEETDETISGDEINAFLSGINEKKDM